MSGGGAKLNRAEELVILLLFMEEIAKMQAPAVEYSIELSKNGKDWTPVRCRFSSFPSASSVDTCRAAAFLDLLPSVSGPVSK